MRNIRFLPGRRREAASLFQHFDDPVDRLNARMDEKPEILILIAVRRLHNKRGERLRLVDKRIIDGPFFIPPRRDMSVDADHARRVAGNAGRVGRIQKTRGALLDEIHGRPFNLTVDETRGAVD